MQLEDRAGAGAAVVAMGGYPAVDCCWESVVVQCGRSSRHPPLTTRDTFDEQKPDL